MTDENDKVGNREYSNQIFYLKGTSFIGVVKKPDLIHLNTNLLDMLFLFSYLLDIAMKMAMRHQK